MSKKVVLLGDLGTDHQGFPPTPVIAGSPDVLIDGKPVARVGDPLAPHSKPKHPPHPRAIAAGSATVLKWHSSRGDRQCIFRPIVNTHSGRT